MPNYRIENLYYFSPLDFWKFYLFMNQGFLRIENVLLYYLFFLKVQPSDHSKWSDDFHACG